MKPEQKQIYYITGETKAKAMASPALERLRKLDYEVRPAFALVGLECLALLRWTSVAASGSFSASPPLSCPPSPSPLTPPLLPQVLLLADPLDEMAVQSLAKFGDKDLIDAAKEMVAETEEEKKELEQAGKETEDLR
jgi:HSP90 family molecular chaperone